MKPNRTLLYLRLASLAFVVVAVLLLVLQLIRFSQIRSNYPPGMVIAGVPVGGLNQQQTSDRLTQAYSVPVELHYNDAVIQVKPQVVGFELNITAMLAAADLQRTNTPFWTGFWEYLWNEMPVPNEVPLQALISEDRLRSYLTDEIAARYDNPPTAYVPVPGTTNFETGTPGSVLDVERAVILIKDAMSSPSARVVNLSINSVSAPRPSLQNLQILLQQVIDVSEFDGITEIYLLDLQTNQELHFAYQSGQVLTPDIAFTAASTMKIPIMASVFQKIGEPAPASIVDQMELMIERSENDPADALMEEALDGNLGPLKVTEDMQKLGFENTFLAGYFYPGAPLLYRYTTPANSRTDINLEPDVYNQTTPAEMGALLDDIYQCAQTGGGPFAVVFPGEITQNECKQMITFLTRNKIGVLIEAGLPEGTQVAHKHGWITEGDGLIHTISDAGIIYTTGGNYVLTIYMNHPIQLQFQPANILFADLSRAVYNYFNLQ